VAPLARLERAAHGLGHLKSSLVHLTQKSNYSLCLKNLTFNATKGQGWQELAEIGVNFYSVGTVTGTVLRPVLGGSLIVDEGMELYTVREVAHRFRRSPRIVYCWIDEGFIKTIRIKRGHLIPNPIMILESVYSCWGKLKYLDI